MDITIRHAEDSDYPAISRIFSFESVTENTSQIPYRNEDYWKELFANNDNHFVQLVAEANGQVVGHLGINLCSKPRRKHVATFGIVIHPEFQGQGVGSHLMDELTRLCDDWLNIIRVELEVFCDNNAAIALYRKFGFEAEGEAKFDCFRQGQFASTLRMARIRPGFGD